MISIAKLRGRLQIPSDQDGEARDILDGLVQLWETKTKRLWTRRVNWVEQFRIDETKRISTLFLQLWPIETIASVEEKGILDTDWTLLDTTQWVNMRANRIERIGAIWQPMVRITYTGGYVSDPDPNATPAQNKTPFDIQEALILQAQFIRTRTTPDRIAIKSTRARTSGSEYENQDYHPTFAAMVLEKMRKV